MGKKKPASKQLRRKRQIKGRRHDVHIKAYMSPEEKAEIEAFCAAQGESASGWLTDLAKAEVRRIMRRDDPTRAAS